MMDDLIGSFSGSVWVRTKHTEQGLWWFMGPVEPFLVTALARRGQGVTDGIRVDLRPW